MALLEFIPDEIFVMILSEWMNSLADVSSLDNAMCHREWRKRYLWWLRLSKQIHIEFEITTNEYQQEIYENMLQWMSLREYYITNCQCVINHFKLDMDDNGVENEEINPILNCLSKFPMTYLKTLTINTFGINIFFSMDYLLPLKQRYPYLQTITVKTSYCRMSPLTLPATTTHSFDQITPYTILPLSSLPRSYLTSYPLTSLDLDRITFTATDWTRFWYHLSHHVAKPLTNIQLDHCEGLSYPILYNILLSFPYLTTFTCQHSLEDPSIQSALITTTFLNQFISPSKQPPENVACAGKCLKIVRLNALCNPAERNDPDLMIPPIQRPPQQHTYNTAYNAFVLNVLNIAKHIEELVLHDVNLPTSQYSLTTNNNHQNNIHNPFFNHHNQLALNQLAQPNTPPFTRIGIQVDNNIQDTFLISMFEEIITNNWKCLTKLYLENCNLFAQDTMHRGVLTSNVDIHHHSTLSPLIHCLSTSCAGVLTELGIYGIRGYPVIWNDYCTKQLMVRLNESKESVCLWKNLQRLDWYHNDELTDDGINAICDPYDAECNDTPQDCAITSISIVCCPLITCLGYIRLIRQFGSQLIAVDFTLPNSTIGPLSILFRAIATTSMPFLEKLTFITHQSTWVSNNNLVHDDAVDEFMRPCHFQFPRLQSLRLENVPMNTVSTQKILTISSELTELCIYYHIGSIHEDELDFSGNQSLSRGKVHFWKHALFT